MSSLLSNLVNKIKQKKTISNLEIQDEYVFSLEEIDSLREENAKKIKDLKEDRIGLKKEEDIIIARIDNRDREDDDLEINEEVVDSDSAPLEDGEIAKDMYLEINKDLDKKEKQEQELEEETLIDNNKKVEEIDKEIEELDKETEEDNIEQNESFVNLSKKNQDLIMKNWNSIDNNEIDKDIINGKDILSHNYNITYGDNAARFVHDIRKKYEIVICYLIGFNNEKNGMMNKTIFSDKMDNEWKYLENYIKLLEKIRNFKK